MRGNRLTPARQLDIVRHAWGEGRRGYVFFPWIPASAGGDKNKRRSNYHEGPAFRWPRDRDRIIAHLTTHQQDEVYWTPSMFLGKRRVEELAAEERSLWADLDEVDPRTIRQDMRPTVAWESSPGRFQAYWKLNFDLVGASWAGKENHRLSVYLGADPSGWDTTQLLRLPGWINNKYPERPRGVLLWRDGPVYFKDDLRDWQLPEVDAPTVTSEELAADEQEIERVDRAGVLQRVRLRLSTDVRGLLQARSATGDRSSVLWRIERELADAGCSVSEIVAVVRSTVWNKYEDRRDELARLRTEAAKAIAARKDTEEELADAEVIEEPKPIKLTSMFKMLEDVERPNWLVDQIWNVGACGFVAGPPKSFKSWIALDLAVSVAAGIPFLGRYRVRDQRRVLYLQEEDPKVLLRERLDKVVAGKDPTVDPRGVLSANGSGPIWSPPRMDIHQWLFSEIMSGFEMDDPEWQTWLADMVRENDLGLVVIDTLMTSIGDVDLDKVSEVKGVLKAIKTIAHTYDCAVCVVHHDRKTELVGGRGNRMLGSVAFYAWAEDMMQVRKKDNEHVVITRESKRAGTFVQGFELPKHEWKPSGVTDEDVTDEQSKKGVIAQAIVEMGGGIYKIQQVADQLGRSRSFVRQHVQQSDDVDFYENGTVGLTKER